MAATGPRLSTADWHALGQDERDAAYNNNLAAPNSAELVAWRNERSAAFRAAHATGLDVPYGPRERNKIDFYPAAERNAPCLVFIHGGYWQRNSREDFACFAEGVMAHGWSVAMPGYTLAPDASLAEIVREIHAALDLIGTQGGTHGVGGPLILSGWSAGGHLTAAALAHESVTAAVAMSGIYDLAPLRDTYLNDKLHLTDAEIADLSPAYHPAVMKPMTITYGADEVPALVHDSNWLYGLRRAAGAPGDLLAVAGANHFSLLEELYRPDGLLVSAALALAR